MAAIWLSEPELRELIGRQEADLLCRTFGGARFYIGHVPHTEHPFCKVIGLAALSALCAAYAGETVMLPNGRKPAPHKSAIVDRLGKGQSQASIAAELGVTVRWVEMVAGRLRHTRQCRLPLL